MALTKLPAACWDGLKDANSLKYAKEYNGLYRRSGCVKQQSVPAVAALWNKGNSWLNVERLLWTSQLRQEINKAITKPLTRCVRHSLKCVCTETVLSTWLILTTIDICSEGELDQRGSGAAAGACGGTRVRDEGRPTLADSFELLFPWLLLFALICIVSVIRRSMIYLTQNLNASVSVESNSVQWSKLENFHLFSRSHCAHSPQITWHCEARSQFTSVFDLYCSQGWLLIIVLTWILHYSNWNHL